MTLTLQKLYADDMGVDILCELTGGGDVCPRCGAEDSYIFATRLVFRCRGCGHQFTWTSGTALSGMKLSPTQLVAIAFVFCANAKGISSVQLSKTVGVAYKTAFIIMHKFREAIEAEIDTLRLSGMIEIDGATFGGHMVQENSVRDGFPKRIRRLKKVDRRILVVAREREGRTVVLAGLRESDAVPRLLEIIEPGSVVIADEAHAWDQMKEALEMLRVSHKFQFSGNGANTNYAESFWSVLRRTHRGVHHKWGGEQVRSYACEIAWRQDFRHETQEQRTMRLLRLCLKSPVSKKWSKYWQRQAA